MMRVLLSLFAFAVMANAVAVPTGACPCPRDDLEACIIALLDTSPADGTVTAAEIDAFIAAQATPSGCLPHHDAFVDNVNSTLILSECDADGSGALTHADFVHADACLTDDRFRNLNRYLCRKCYDCGWSGPAKRKR